MGSLDFAVFNRSTRDETGRRVLNRSTRNGTGEGRVFRRFVDDTKGEWICHPLAPPPVIPSPFPRCVIPSSSPRVIPTEGAERPSGGISPGDTTPPNRGMLVRMKSDVAMILAAGRGHRMRPLSDYLPKPALSLPSGPVISHAMRLAARYSRRYVINSWWLADRMEKAIRKSQQKNRIPDISREMEQMETAGGLALARDRGLLGNEGPVLVINGDGLLNLDLRALWERHLDKNEDITLALLPHLDPTRWSRVNLDGKGLVRALRPPGIPDPGEVPLLYPGVMLISRRALNALECRPSGLAQTAWKAALEKEKMGAAIVSGHWREIGRPEDYLEAVLQSIGGRVFAHLSARIHRLAEVENSYIGRDCRIGSGASVENSVLDEGVRVPDGAIIRNSVLLGPFDSGKNLEGFFGIPEEK